jgi:hypothetical protein
MAFALNLVPIVMVIGLLTPVVGQAVDHHYVDRSPAHDHVFVGEETNLHDHSLSLASHDHSAGEATGDGISIASTSASSAHGPLTLDGATLESSIPNYNHHMIAIQVGEPSFPDEEAISPPDRPPHRA